MKKLIQGILDFRKNVLPSRREVFAKLATGQAPDVLFITCSDSRVAPNWFASTDPGDLFVIRNVGNLVPPCPPNGNSSSDHSVAAAIEFSLSNLPVSHIVVCGHSGCGAIHALAGGIEKVSSSHLRNWLSHGERSVRNPPSALRADPALSSEDKLSQGNVLQQIENLKTYPNIREKLQNRKLKLHGWWFNIGQGSVYAYDNESHQFILIDDRVGASLLNSE